MSYARLIQKIDDKPVNFVKLFDDVGRQPYDYQEEFLNDKSNKIIVKKGRQVGASQMVAWRVVYEAFMKPNQTILVVSPSQRQSNLIFKKIRNFARHEVLEKSLIGDSWSKLELTNGSEIYSLPSGETGATIRGFKGDGLVIDEGAFMREAVWNAIEDSTMRGGWMIIMSTPMGTSNKFYDYYQKDIWSKYDIPCTRCPDITPEKIEEKRNSKSHLEFLQEIMGEFITTATLWFDPEIVKGCIYGFKIDEGERFLAVDPARHGADSGVIMEGVKIDQYMFVTRIWAWNNKGLNHYFGEMKRLHDYNRYSKIYVDETGLGGGIIDFLEEEEDWFKNAVEGITFTPDKKAALYTNLLKLAEEKKVLLPENHKYTTETIRQWSAIERDTTKTGKSRATSKIGKDDFVDALALLAWGARITKGTLYFRGG